MTSKNQCGFLTVIYYCELNEINRAEAFSNEHHIVFNKKLFGAKRRAARAHLQRSSPFINSGSGGADERARFIKYFSLDNFVKLSNTEKIKHSLRQCTECASKHKEHFILKKGNSGKNLAQTPKALSPLAILNKTPEQITQEDFNVTMRDVVLPIKKTMAKTPFKSNFLKRVLGKDKVDDLSCISKTAKRALLKSETKSIQESAVEKDCLALFSSKVSANEWQTLNRDSFGEIRHNKVKSHTGNLDGYQYDRIPLLEALEKGDVENWTSLSKAVRLTRKSNNQPPQNAGQVTKMIAKSLGYNAPIKRKIRTSWINYQTTALNAPKRTNYPILKRCKDELIQSGEVNIGTPIVPIEYTISTVENGKMIKTVHETYGRKISLKSIRSDHLQRMKSLGLLREMNVNEMDITDVERTIEKYGIPISGRDDLRAVLDEYAHTRHFAIWHDHSELSGKSHYLFMVWFLYDELIYFNDEEYARKNLVNKEVNVQGTVEQPYVYILARSGSSVKDQILYVPSRLEDLMELKELVIINNREYVDRMRFFSGDTPARELETGQSMGGKYPCPCGVKDEEFRNRCTFNQRGPFDSLEARHEMITATPTWKTGAREGNLAVYENLKTDQLLTELGRRGVEQSYTEKAPELKALLANHMRGIRRPPALLCVDSELDLATYEVAQTEPLHDFKNTINRVLEELPFTIKEPELRKEIEEITKELRGGREMKGTDCRLTIIKMAAVLAERDEPEVHQLHAMVLALVEMQKIAYTPQSHLTPRVILRAYNQCFVFAIICMNLFQQPKKNTPRHMFGMPFHCLTVHMPETLRLVSGRAIVAEHAERHFNKLRSLTKRTTNNHAESVISDSLFRLAMERRKTAVTTDFERQQNQVCQMLAKTKVSKSSDQLFLGRNAILTNKFLSANKTASLIHMKRIADYLEIGPDKWYRVHPTALEFLDGDTELESITEGPCPTHFRSHSLRDINRRLDKSWQDVLSQNSHLKLPLIDSLTSKPKPTTMATPGIDADTITVAQIYSMEKPQEVADIPDSDIIHCKSASNEPIFDEPPTCTSSSNHELPDESTSFVCAVPLLIKEANTAKVAEKSHIRERDASCESVSDIVSKVWIGDQTILQQYLEAKRADKSRPTLLTKMNRKLAASHLKPVLQLLKSKVLKKEHDEAITKFSAEGMLPMDSTESSRAIKAIEHMAKQLQ